MNTTTAISTNRENIEKFIQAYQTIRRSDAFINIIYSKIDTNIISNLELDDLLQSIVHVHPEKYIEELFATKLVTILEVFLKQRIIEEFETDKNAMTRFILGYNHIKKITPQDIIDGADNYSLGLVNDIIFHNLPKVDKVYSIVFNIDIKKLCNFEMLMSIISMRHFIIHEDRMHKKKKVSVFNSQTFLNEINILVENIEFAVKNGRPKKRHKRIDIHGYNKMVKTEDAILYETKKVWNNY